jgi:hypothetical protein
VPDRCCRTPLPAAPLGQTAITGTMVTACPPRPGGMRTSPVIPDRRDLVRLRQFVGGSSSRRASGRKTAARVNTDVPTLPSGGVNDHTGLPTGIGCQTSCSRAAGKRTQSGGQTASRATAPRSERRTTVVYRQRRCVPSSGRSMASLHHVTRPSVVALVPHVSARASTSSSP